MDLEFLTFELMAVGLLLTVVGGLAKFMWGVHLRDRTEINELQRKAAIEKAVNDERQRNLDRLESRLDRHEEQGQEVRDNITKLLAGMDEVKADIKELKGKQG